MVRTVLDSVTNAYREVHGRFVDTKILVVDDEPDVVDMILRHLEMEGYDVSGETDPEVALERVQEENIKVLVTDIKMPEMSGVELLKEVKRIDGTIEVVMITGYGGMNLLVSSLSNGANDCIFKPLDIDQLRKALDDSIEKLNRWERRLGELNSLKTNE